MVTKFNNLSLLYDFVALETTVDLNHFPKAKFILLGPGISFVAFFQWLPHSAILPLSVLT